MSAVAVNFAQVLVVGLLSISTHCGECCCCVHWIRRDVFVLQVNERCGSELRSSIGRGPTQ
ncbi:jg14269, partial [Pararge aegeria aegeria]